MWKLMKRFQISTLRSTYTLKIDPKVETVVHGSVRKPKALVEEITSKLKEMQKGGHILPVTTPNDWISSMVVVLKKNRVKMCLDPKDLNKAIRREHYPIPTVEDVASFPKAKVFVLDAKSGFLQIKLDYESSLLTTFNTPIGCYRFLRLLFGVKSAPEIFQRIMGNMLQDILIGGENKAHHDLILNKHQFSADLTSTETSQYNAIQAVTHLVAYFFKIAYQLPTLLEL
ncbi:uncharacterized protein K02A2.6-like [Gigantopelta aegis]|uniref:uncharacterized protein K02A2.6-like n=1 Tax=Gigantopelta aegis TaxID=1735272 RepID=UPI001B88E475|nr:uncharacterized protein K02A2.6-like [Gigantopelta aegis]